MRRPVLSRVSRAGVLPRPGARSGLGATVATLLAGTIAACAGDEGSSAAASSAAGSGHTVRDSAGIRIVESHDSAWTEETRWRLADEPDFVIGSFDGSVPGTDFGSNVTPALLGDRVIVLDTSNGDLRMFDQDGAYLRTLSRRGRGPTELATARRMATFGDSVAIVWDIGNRKMVRFDLTGDSVSSQPIGDPPHEPPGSAPALPGMSLWAVRDWFGDESYVVTSAVLRLSGHPPGRSTYTEPWHRISAAGEHLSKIGEFPARELWSNDVMGMGMVFTPVGTLTPLDSTLLQAYPIDAFEFTERRPDGSPKSIVRAAVPRRAVTDGLVAALREREEASSRASPEAASGPMRERLEAIADLQRTRTYPDSVAPFSDLLVTPSGHVLAELTDPDWRTTRPDTADQPRTYRYVVFDPDGRWLGTLAAPAGLEIAEIGDNALVGVRRDEFDVPYVERWRIIRPVPSG